MIYESFDEIVYKKGSSNIEKNAKWDNRYRIAGIFGDFINNNQVKIKVSIYLKKIILLNVV